MQEDIFSEELVDEPDDIERVIEAGTDEVQEGSGRDSDNEDKKKEDESAKDKIKIKRKLGPRPVVNAQRLKGPRGIGIMESFFSDIRFKGKGREKEDLDRVMGRLEHWAHRLAPRMQFDEALKKIEKLGTKKEVANYVKRIRLGMEEDVSETGLDEETGHVDEPHDSSAPVDAFDQLMNSSVVPVQPASMEMTEEQRERMLQNRLIAEEIRSARIKRAQALKEKFLASQKLNQTENSQNVELGSKVTTQENDVQRNNHEEVQMEIDDNIVPGKSSESDNNIVNGENKENLGSFQTERNDIQFNFEDEENWPNLMQKERIEQEVPMEDVENHPDVLMERNEAQPDIILGSENGPDVVRRNLRESSEYQPDIVSTQNNLPDILL